MKLRFLISMLVLACASGVAQRPGPDLPVAFRFTATEANSPPGSCGCFQLYGGAADVAVPVRDGFSAVLEIAGNHAGLVPATVRGLSTITLLAGPRYTLSLGRGQQVFAQSLFGAVRGFDAEFRRGSDAIDTATAFGYALGGAYELPITRTLSLRAVQIEYLQTNLPNGSDNRQRNLRVGAGVVLRIPTHELGRR